MLNYMGNYRYCKKHNIKMPMSYEMANLYLNLGYEIIVIKITFYNSFYVKIKKGDRDFYGTIIPLKRSDIRRILTTYRPSFILEKCFTHIEHL